MSLIELAERGQLPDALIRLGMRRLCAQRLRDERAHDVEGAHERLRIGLRTLRASAVAIETAAANEQHYELPPRFFELCLGPRLKYSSCLFPRGDETLAQGEEAMLAQYGERAQLADGQRILELGCGWGSLTLWMAERFPQSKITAVSNSRPQREFIEARCRARSLSNVHVITEDINRLELPEATFDRCVSIEMFEHMRNYEALLARVAGWLKPQARLFVHIFCHRTVQYPFEVEGEDNWMGRYFFTGGQMPSFSTLLNFQEHFVVEDNWQVSGRHYQRSAELWLRNQDAARTEVLEVLRGAYGDAAPIWNQRWRMFWMACAELFGYDDGNEWIVGHYRFVRR